MQTLMDTAGVIIVQIPSLITGRNLATFQGTQTIANNTTTQVVHEYKVVV